MTYYSSKYNDVLIYNIQFIMNLEFFGQYWKTEWKRLKMITKIDMSYRLTMSQ